MTNESWRNLFGNPQRPEIGLKLFASPGKRGKRETDAIIGSDEIDWDLYCFGYCQAAEVLIDRFLEKRNDYSAAYESQAFAIIFLYRHYLELRLKELYIAYGRLLGDSVDIKGHKLVNLWKRVCDRDKASRIETEPVPEIDEDSEVLQGIVEQFDSIDPNSEVFRYPVLKDGKSVTLPRMQIGLLELRQTMRWVSYYLDGWSVGVDEYIKAKHEHSELEA